MIDFLVEDMFNERLNAQDFKFLERISGMEGMEKRRSTERGAIR